MLTALTTASAIGLPPVIYHGTEEQKRRWLPGIFEGQTAFCLGATEPSGGSDLANLKTTARKTEDGKYYIVNGYKVGMALHHEHWVGSFDLRTLPQEMDHRSFVIHSHDYGSQNWRPWSWGRLGARDRDRLPRILGTEDRKQRCQCRR